MVPFDHSLTLASTIRRAFAAAFGAGGGFRGGRRAWSSAVEKTPQDRSPPDATTCRLKSRNDAYSLPPAPPGPSRLRREEGGEGGGGEEGGGGGKETG